MTTREERGKWKSKTEFILVSLGYAVGLGNVARFPYLVGDNGGGAFLIPYLIMTIFVAIPTFYMEAGLGQYAGVSPMLLYNRLAPIAAGIGVTMVIINAITAIYYNMIIAWSLRYLFASFRSTLPWTYCTNKWNTKHCYDYNTALYCKNTDQIYSKGRCNNWTAPADSKLIEEAAAIFKTKNETPAEEYLDIYVMRTSDGIHNLGTPQWDLVISLAGAWIITFLCLVRGIQSAGKIAYFTVIFPYVLLVIFFIRGVSLPGAYVGIQFLLFPNMSRLVESGVWAHAAQQVCFSLFLGGGVAQTVASYNDFHNNLFPDTFIIVIGNAMTSFLSGFVVFSILGYIAHKTGRDIKNVAKEGITLSFVAYAEAITQISPAPLWSVLFFFMLVLLGIDSEMMNCDTVLRAIFDVFPYIKSGKQKAAVTAAVCFGMFLVGLCLTTPGGVYLLTMMDQFGSGWPLLAMCLIQITTITWLYGVKRFISDINLMFGVTCEGRWYKQLTWKMNPFWWICWIFASPCILTFTIIFMFVRYERTHYKDYIFPVRAEVIGWMLFLACFSFIPGFAAYKLIRNFNEGREIKSLFRPTEDWAPPPDVVTPAQKLLMQKITDKTDSPVPSVRKGNSNISLKTAKKRSSQHSLVSKSDRR